MYYAETQIIKSLPKMIDKAVDPQLRQAFKSHLKETENHVIRLQGVSQMHGKDVNGVTCEAMDGILAEAKQVMSEVGDADVSYAAMLSSAQAVEH
jgi:ferritin-like metal-binding protein YciE